MGIVIQFYFLNGLALIGGYCLDIFFTDFKKPHGFKKIIHFISFKFARLVDSYSKTMQWPVSIILLSSLLLFIFIPCLLLLFFIFQFNTILFFIIIMLFYFMVFQTSSIEMKMRELIQTITKNQLDQAKSLLFKMTAKTLIIDNMDDVKRKAIEIIAIETCSKFITILCCATIGGPALVLVAITLENCELDSKLIRDNNLYVQLVDNLNRMFNFIPMYITVGILLVASNILNLHTKYALAVFKKNSAIAFFNYKEQLVAIYFAALELPLEKVTVQGVDQTLEDTKDIIKALQLMKLISFISFIVISVYYLLTKR